MLELELSIGNESMCETEPGGDGQLGCQWRILNGLPRYVLGKI